MSNLTYWKEVKTLDKFFLKILKSNRKKIYNIFLKNICYNNSMSLLDVGTTAVSDENHNIILQKLKDNPNITCLSDQNCSSLKEIYPHVKSFITGDGKKNIFDNNMFDIVHSSATIEHVGSLEDQLTFVSECFRVAKKSVFITTPNRNYPIDFHTKLPLIHLLPKKIHRKILKKIGLSFFSKEENLNLLSERDLISICKKLRFKNFYIVKHKFCFFTSNLILIINK